MEVQQVNKLGRFCSSSQRSTYWVQGRSLARTFLRIVTINCLTFEENTGQPYKENLCLFRASALHMHGKQRLEEETSKLFNLFINKMVGLTLNQFQGVHMNDIPTFEDLLTLNILLYDIDIVDGNIIRELARGSMQKNNNTVRLLRYNNLICYVTNINAAFQAFRYPNCDTFFSRAFNLERHLTTCSERVKNVYPRNVYQIRGTLFDKLDSFGINYTSEQKLFKNLAIFDFESICLQEETSRDTNTTTWIGEHVPISVSISSNLVEEPIFFCNSDPHHLIASFIGALENLASQSKALIKNLLPDTATAIKINLGSILEKLMQHHNRREQADLDDCDNEICASTQFLQIQKNQLIDLQESLERYCKVLPVFGFNSAKCDLNLIKSYLLPILFNEEERLLSQPRKMLISIFTLQNGTLITPLLLFYLQLGLVCTKILLFVEYTPKKCLNRFVQAAVDARRKRDENPNSIVVTETMTHLANSSYGYQIMDQSRHTVTKYLTDEKTHAAINCKLFKKLDHVNNSLYEVELAKSEIEHKEPITVGFFILQYAKLRMLELYYNFFTRFCDVNKFEELEMDTDSLYLALAEKELEDCIRPEMKAE